MLYYLFEYLERAYNFPGASLFGFITFRAAIAIIMSLAISTIWGKRIILYLQKKQLGESIRDLGLEGQVEKAGTPTMGGLIIILATLIPVFLLAKLENIYVILLIVTTLWMGAIGFMDDFLKIRKKNKEGLQGKFKIFGQVGLGIIVGATIFFHPGVTVKDEIANKPAQQEELVDSSTTEFSSEEKALTTTIPFVKNNEIDYSILVSWLGEDYVKYAWL
ncbi:MAG: phospho-N-acetylmuramoyl-pentapeptide-transferase, partial [Bacteroidota bacterium]|nr:phospho-N-acetylmuramoyl-pentapeptide-transferase [Bacteroidota bacterium]